MINAITITDLEGNSFVVILHSHKDFKKLSDYLCELDNDSDASINDVVVREYLEQENISYEIINESEIFTISY